MCKPKASTPGIAPKPISITKIIAIINSGIDLKKINKDFGTTILCNLHQVDLAKKYSDRLVGLLDGKIIFDEKSNNINKTDLEKIYI